MRSLLLLAALSLALGACTEDHSTIWVARLAAPELDDGACTASALQPSNSSLSAGSPYTVFLVVANGVRDNTRPLANNTSAVVLEGVEVTLTDSAGAALGGSYTQLIGGLVPSANVAGQPEQLVVSATIIPANVSSALAPGSVVVATMQVYGHTLGGFEVESAPFFWPITIEAPLTCTVCSDEATAADECTPGQDGGCAVVTCTP